jgi:hypothetical protein
MIGAEGESISLFDCRFPNCGWFALSPFAGLLGIAVAGGAILARRRGGAAALLVAGCWVTAAYLGLWGFFLSTAEEFGVSVEAAGPLGVIGGLIAVAGGVMAHSGRADPSAGGVSPGRMGAPSTGLRLGASAAATSGAALSLVGALLPYVSFDDGGDVSVFDCGFGGCGWFALEPIGLAVIGLGAAALISAGRVGAPVGSAVLATSGLWDLLLFAGYTGQATGEGFGTSSVEAGGPIGVAGGLALVAGAAILLLGGRANRPVVSAPT